MAAIPGLAGAWWDWISSITVQVSILVMLVWAVDRGLRGKLWPDVLSVMWVLVVARVFLPVSLPSFAHITDVASLPFHVTEVMAVSTNTARAGSESFPWIAVGMVVWVAGVLSMAGWIIGVARAYALTYRPPDPVTEGWISDALRTSARQIGLRRCPTVVISDSLPSAGVFGMFRPVVVVPSGTEPGVDTGNILLHECAHIKRRDPLLHAVSLVAVVLFWFNPLIWLAHRKLTHLREVCCDALVANTLREKTPGYQETLLAVAEKMMHRRPVAGVVGILGIVEENSMLITRIQWLDKMLWKRSRARSILTGVAVMLMMALVIPAISAGKKEVTAPSSALKMWQVDVQPKKINKVQAEYPEDLKKAGIQGNVWVSFIVTAKGDVTDVTVAEPVKKPDGTVVARTVSTKNAKLRNAAIAAVKQWKFQPAAKDGKLVAMRMVNKVEFRLD